MCGLGEDEAETVVRHRLTPVVWEREQMEWLERAVVRLGAEPLDVHLEVDTGMARQGVALGGLEAVLGWMAERQGVRLGGCDDALRLGWRWLGSRADGGAERGRFEEAMRAVAAAGLRPEWVHVGSSSVIDNLGIGNRGSDNGGDGLLSWLRGVAGGCWGAGYGSGWDWVVMDIACR